MVQAPSEAYPAAQVLRRQSATRSRPGRRSYTKEVIKPPGVGSCIALSSTRVVVTRGCQTPPFGTHKRPSEMTDYHIRIPEYLLTLATRRSGRKRAKPGFPRETGGFGPLLSAPRAVKSRLVVGVRSRKASNPADYVGAAAPKRETRAIITVDKRGQGCALAMHKQPLINTPNHAGLASLSKPRSDDGSVRLR